jgi:hypothetical protein
MAGLAEKILEALREQEHVREEGGKLVCQPDAEVALYIDQKAEILAVPRVTTVVLQGGLLRITTGRGEVYVFAADSLTGFRLQLGEQKTRDRGAGFVG